MKKEKEYRTLFNWTPCRGL